MKSLLGRKTSVVDVCPDHSGPSDTLEATPTMTERSLLSLLVLIARRPNENKKPQYNKIILGGPMFRRPKNKSGPVSRARKWRTRNVTNGCVTLRVRRFGGQKRTRTNDDFQFFESGNQIMNQIIISINVIRLRLFPTWLSFKSCDFVNLAYTILRDV